MKLLLIISCFLPFTVLAQERQLKNEIGISFMNVRANLGPNCFSPDFTTPAFSIKSSRCNYGASMYNSMRPEIYFTRRLRKKWKLRSSLGWFEFAQPLPNQNQPFAQFIEKKYIATIGIQWEFYNFNKWSFYTGAEALGIMSKEIRYYRSLDEIYSTWSSLEYTIMTKILFGTRYKISKRFSASTEASLAWGYFPISRLSINYHF